MKMQPKSPKRLGEVLADANLITTKQLEIALLEQAEHPHRRLGDILADRGWLKKETADFFAQQWHKLIHHHSSHSSSKLGDYLQQAGLLTPHQVETIINEQKNRRLWMRFGAMAVFKGWVSLTTVDYFVEHLFPHRADDSPFVKPKTTNISAKKPNVPLKSLFRSMKRNRLH